MSHQAHWLYLDLNSFFSSCEQQENPELRHSPLAIVPMLADSTFCIAASYSAKAFGVKTGVRVGDAEAKAYNRHFPFLYDLSGGGLIAFSEMNPYVTGRQAGVSL